MTDRYTPKRLRGKVISQGGLNIRDRYDRSSVRVPIRTPARAIVLAAYTPDDPNNQRGTGVECDVMFISTQGKMFNVPVMQLNHGVNNLHDLWVPKATTRDMSGSTLNTTGAVTKRGNLNEDGSTLTNFSEMDGDMVLVDFIESRVDFPIIIGAVSHEQTKRVVTDGTGWAAGDASSRGTPEAGEFYISHSGSEVRVNGNGDVLIDTVGANADPVNEDPSTGAGQMRIRIKDAHRFTVECDGVDVLEVFKDGTGVHIDLGEGATEHIVLGDALLSLFNAHVHPVPFGGASGPPTTPMVAGTHLSTQHRVK